MKKIFIFDNREARINYAEALEFCGGTPVFSQDLSQAGECDGLLIPGGGDIDPARYGQEINGSTDIDPVKDQQEIQLVQEFSAAGKPILGICRGLQIINVTFGGDMIQNIETASAHKWEESTGDKVHRVTATEGGFLYPLYGKNFAVNSAHHQAVKNTAEGFTIAARAEDGTIEALENREKNIYGVQWHPERMCFNNSRTDTADGRYIFEFFLSLFR